MTLPTTIEALFKDIGTDFCRCCNAVVRDDPHADFCPVPAALEAVTSLVAENEAWERWAGYRVGVGADGDATRRSLQAAYDAMDADRRRTQQQLEQALEKWNKDRASVANLVAQLRSIAEAIGLDGSATVSDVLERVRSLPRPPSKEDSAPPAPAESKRGCGEAGCDGHIHLGAGPQGEHVWCPAFEEGVRSPVDEPSQQPVIGTTIDVDGIIGRAKREVDDARASGRTPMVLAADVILLGKVLERERGYAADCRAAEQHVCQERDALRRKIDALSSDLGRERSEKQRRCARWQRVVERLRSQTRSAKAQARHAEANRFAAVAESRRQHKQREDAVRSMESAHAELERVRRERDEALRRTDFDAGVRAGLSCALSLIHTELYGPRSGESVVHPAGSAELGPPSTPSRTWQLGGRLADAAPAKASTPTAEGWWWQIGSTGRPVPVYVEHWDDDDTLRVQGSGVLVGDPFFRWLGPASPPSDPQT